MSPICAVARGSNVGRELLTQSGEAGADLLVTTARGGLRTVPGELIAAAAGEPVPVVLPETSEVRLIARSLLEHRSDLGRARLMDAAQVRVFDAQSGAAYQQFDHFRRTLGPWRSVIVHPSSTSVMSLQLPVGTWAIELRSEDGTTWQGQVTVRAGEAASLVL